MSASPPPPPPPALPPAHTQRSLGLDTPPSQPLLMPTPQQWYGPLQTLQRSHPGQYPNAGQRTMSTHYYTGAPPRPPFDHLGDIQPWRYNQYPSGTLPGVLPHPNDVRTHHALAHVGVGELGVTGQPPHMPVDPPMPRRMYPNDIMSEGTTHALGWSLPVGMEIKNVVETRKPAKKDKRMWQDSIPPPVVAELKDQLAHLTELQVYCYIEPMGKGIRGGHCQLSNGEMTLWAKYIVQEHGLVTKHSPPNIKMLDYPPTPKARVVANAPSGIDEGVKEEIIKSDELTNTFSAPEHHPLGRMICIWKSHQQLMKVLTLSIVSGRLPTTREVLTLMDAEFPSNEETTFMESCGDLLTFDIHDVLDIYRQETLFLATFGTLGQGGTGQLRQYTWDKILIPLDVLETKADPFENIADTGDFKRIIRWRSSVELGLEDTKDKEGDVVGEEEVVVVSGGGASSEVEEIKGWGDVGCIMQEE
ncbi:hypothetical protein EI94DRAFT_1700914 [Lactarius quietus]|nr:hypothetical protein EI94DRAFT_1700914 [Lactarius quietus]